MRKGDTTLTLRFACAEDKKAFLTYQKWWVRELKKREDHRLSNDGMRGPKAFAYAEVVGTVIPEQTLPVTERCRFCGCEWLCPDCGGGVVGACDRARGASDSRERGDDMTDEHVVDGGNNCGAPGCEGPKKCEEPGCDAEHANGCSASLSMRGWRCPKHARWRFSDAPNADYVVREFARAIMHGDEQHQAWLLAAAEAYLAGQEMPPPVPAPAHDPGHPHLIDGEFQSDKYPSCPRGKVPLSTKDPLAQDLLWIYKERRRAVDAEFADDLDKALRLKGYQPPASIDGIPSRGPEPSSTPPWKFYAVQEGNGVVHVRGPSWVSTRIEPVERDAAYVLHACSNYQRLHEIVEKLLAMDQPWSLLDVLGKLVNATEHLLQDHDCDHHSYESYDHAREAARRHLVILRDLLFRGADRDG